MDRIIDFLRLHFPTRRRLIQLYAALLCNAHIKGYIKGDIYTGPLKNVCVPGLNCYSCPGAVGACPLGALQNALASSNKRAPYFIMGILLLMGLTFGRTICGFFCPFGLIQELLYKINVPKIRKSRVTHLLSYLKYVVLIVFVILIPLRYSVRKYPVPAFCKYICPAGTLEGAVGLLANPANESKLSMLNILFTRKFIIAVIIIAACIFLYRAFCRFLCPLGAIYGLFNRVSLLGIRVDANQCIDCGKCIGHCKMDIRYAGDHECIHCGDCIRICPVGAISYKFGTVTLMSNLPEEGERNSTAVISGKKNASSGHRDNKKNSLRMKAGIAWAAALLVLALVIRTVNKPESPDDAMTESAVETESLETVGSDVGDICPDFTAPVYGSDEPFILSEHRGRIVIINFWATYCTPCCAELPDFDRFYTTYGKDVDVIALHVQADYDGAEEYLSGYDFSMPFGHDETGEIIKSLGGSTLLPMTVIVDGTGHIVYNDTSSMTFEKLESIVLPLLTGQELSDGNTGAGEDAVPAEDLSSEVDQESIELGDRFPDFTVELSDGSQFTLSEALKDHKAVLISIWATWCRPCKNEFPYLNEAYKNYSEDVAVVCLSCDKADTADAINSYKKENGLDLPMGYDSSDIYPRMGLGSVPINILVDRFGNYTFISAVPVPSAGAYERLFEYYISDDYEQSVVLEGIPGQKPDVAPLSDEELSEAVCPDGSLKFTTPTEDESYWPFVKAAGGGVTNSNARKDPVTTGSYCTAAMETVLHADAGDVFSFDYTVDSQIYYDGLCVTIDGEDDRLIGGKETGTYVYEFQETGTYEISLSYLTNGYLKGSSDSTVVRNASLTSGEDAQKLIQENTVIFPQTLEGNELSLTIDDSREIVFDDPDDSIAGVFGEGLRFFVVENTDEARAHICLGKEINPYFATYAATISPNYANEDAVLLTRCGTDETGFNYVSKLSKKEEGGRCYNYLRVSSDFGNPENNRVVNYMVFANEENANSFAELFGLSWKYADGTNPSTDKTAEGSDTSISSSATYTIHIVDETGAPVDGCVVNICTDSVCSPEKATNGELTFTKDAYPYIIHIIQYPDGYEFNKDTEFIMPKEGGELTITIPHDS